MEHAQLFISKHLILHHNETEIPVGAPPQALDGAASRRLEGVYAMVCYMMREWSQQCLRGELLDPRSLLWADQDAACCINRRKCFLWCSSKEYKSMCELRARHANNRNSEMCCCTSLCVGGQNSPGTRRRTVAKRSPPHQQQFTVVGPLVEATQCTFGEHGHTRYPWPRRLLTGSIWEITHAW